MEIVRLVSQPYIPSAAAWWNLFYLFLFFGTLAGGIVVGLMLYFVYKYRYKEGQRELEYEPSPLRFRVREAIILAMISGVLLYSLTIVSYRTLTIEQNPPPPSNTLFIQVTAMQWSFKFKYPNNVTTVGEVRLPAESPILFNVTSIDVMHNFGLPAFKLKIDAIPGVYNTLFITTPALDGQTELHYQIRCYELCGSGHSFMMANLVVVSPTAFNQWLSQMAMNMTKA